MADKDRHGDPVLARGLTQPAAARRAAAWAAWPRPGWRWPRAAAAASPKPPVVHAQNAVARFWAAQKQHGHVNFANWPLYIDTGHKTLEEFTATTGITVSYTEVIQSAPSWVNKMSPIIRAGRVHRLRHDGGDQRVLVLPAAHHG